MNRFPFPLYFFSFFYIAHNKNSITDFSVKSSTYSHSWHMNQSVSVHWSASSRVMRSSSLQPQQDTITSSVITRPLSIGWIISLVLSLITGNSIAQFEIIASFFFTFYHLFLASYCDPVSRLRGPRRGGDRVILLE